MSKSAPILSDGTPSTLGNWRAFAVILGGRDPNPATKFLDKKIAQQGADEPVIAPESQMMFLITSLLAPEETCET